MKNPQLKNFPCFKQCILLFMTISVVASWAIPTNFGKLQKCPSGLDLYSPHSLKPSAIKLIVTGLNTWPSKGLLITYCLIILN